MFKSWLSNSPFVRFGKHAKNSSLENYRRVEHPSKSLLVARRLLKMARLIAITTSARRPYSGVTSSRFYIVSPHKLTKTCGDLRRILISHFPPTTRYSHTMIRTPLYHVKIRLQLAQQTQQAVMKALTTVIGIVGISIKVVKALNELNEALKQDITDLKVLGFELLSHHCKMFPRRASLGDLITFE